MAEVQIGSILVRKALPDDGPALASAIEQINGETVFLAEPGQALGWAESAQQRLREMETTDSGLYMVATHARTIIGYVGAFSGRLARMRSVIFMRHLGVRQSFRGQGLGRRLVKSIESWARAKQAHRLELRVDEHNAAALSLYRGTGFEIEGRIADAVRLDDRWHAHYWMGLPIRARTEPPWNPLDLPRPERRQHIGRVTLRAPLPADARLIWEWERTLLAGSPFHLKLLTEVSDTAWIAAELAANAVRKDRFGLAAFAGPEPGRIVGLVHAWIEPGARIRHDAMFGLNVLPEWSGIGVGRKLANALEAWARSLGIRRLTTWVQAHNVRGLRFADNLRFEREVLVREYAVIDGHVAGRIGLGKVLC